MEFLDILSKYWSILLFIGGIVGSWTYYKSQLTELDKRMTKLETEREIMESSINELKRIAVKIETTLGFILEKLNTK